MQYDYSFFSFPKTKGNNINQAYLKNRSITATLFNTLPQALYPSEFEPVEVRDVGTQLTRIPTQLAQNVDQIQLLGEQALPLTRQPLRETVKISRRIHRAQRIPARKLS